MHPKIHAAFNEIDAAVFSGDTFYDPENLAELKRMLERWQGHVEWLETMAKEQAEDAE